MPASDTVFDVVYELAQRFGRGSKALPAQVDYTPVSTVLCFSALGIELAIPLEELAEVLEVPAYTRLPRVKSWVAGVASVRGKLLPIVDLAAFLGAEMTTTTKLHRVLVIDMHGIYVGLLVDSVIGVRHFNTELFSSYRTDVPSLLSRYVLGCFVEEDGAKTRLFRPAQFITDRSFLDVAV